MVEEQETRTRSGVRRIGNMDRKRSSNRIRNKRLKSRKEQEGAGRSRKRSKNMSKNMSRNMSRDRRGTGPGIDAETGPGQHTLNIWNKRKGGQNY
jgi:hypothetical protein